MEVFHRLISYRSAKNKPTSQNTLLSLKSALLPANWVLH